MQHHNGAWHIWVKYGGVFVLLWILLTQANIHSWMIGVLVVAAATWSAIYLFPRSHHTSPQPNQSIRLSAWLRFIPFFIEQSLKGGWETALFAWHPRRRVQPGFIQYDTRLPAGRPQLYFMNVVSLLPGTVSAGRHNGAMVFHALDTNADNHQALRQCEIEIAKLFNFDITGFTSDATVPDTKAQAGEQQ